MYLVTTQADRIPTDYQIIMVDGTVPDWEAKPGDLHWDHHRPNGADVQIDEIPAPKERSLIEEQSTHQPPCFVTTMVDPDACCAAAWVQLPRPVLTDGTIAKLKAIAWDCDHLMVPEELKQYAEFAAKAVVALKHSSEGIAADLGLPPERKEWTEDHWQAYSSEAFRRGTEWLIEAAKGDCPYPGESGEAEDYWQQIEADTQMLIDEQRIRFIQTERGEVAVCDQTSVGQGIDPRSFYQAIPRLRDASAALLRPEAITVRDHRSGGMQYTLGSIPLHPQQHSLDFTQGVFDRLTQAELAKDPESGSWGGRRTVGGSPWNTASKLTVEAIVALLG
ncbi:hypothetical protein [Leptolyngbya sp. FACHB-17]|uniref:hypothetical protein n=1 Tax=unclassified Leptolyngbya TaxID=2650499 RepID=UPI001680E26A|nr:hypothetical protein [Leptolyngbya sp. FACHB-17]MBD2083358.1 hypothetical protein [Leptolyngbya sp. FACHB-17]